jgi:two-component system response regulator LytT
VSPAPEPVPASVSAGDERKASAESSEDLIPVELGGLTRFVRQADVLFAEAEGDYARLHTAKESFLVRVPLTTLEQRWHDAGFVRIHRSHLVALKHVDELRLDAGRLTVRIGGKVLAVSRRHTRQLRDLMVRNARLNPQKGTAR